uniref:Heparosan-N-sulfate-glucuronate 5-epimerase n=1 Tax=Heterorhabditis bacteriophora TaxID=37862 RepID=A0A1I7XPP4_HETBA
MIEEDMSIYVYRYYLLEKVLFKNKDHSSRFEWFTSYSKIRVPDGNSYDPFGPFGHFATYSVETRDRVRCISAETVWITTLQSDEIMSMDFLTVVFLYVIFFQYICLDFFSFSLGKLNDSWYSVTRDALMDASRALSSLNTSKRKEGNVVLHPGDIRLVSLGFRGKLTVRQKVRQSSSANDKFFITAADWMVKNQNKEGGWSVPVERSIADRRLVLGAGWHSAMAQPASLGGVMNELFGHPWYEEYPTTPGSFVLNGFMYALIGLYDMSKVIPAVEAPDNIKTGPLRARALFEAGLDSLRLFIPLYDTGSGSIYDLRHIGLQTAPNLARWDYHAVHVYLLKWLVQITGDKILDETADRWIAYSYGKRAKHN